MKDWGFLPDIPEELIRMRNFNPQLRYLAGVTADEAAYIVCEFIFYLKLRKKKITNNVSV